MNLAWSRISDPDAERYRTSQRRFRPQMFSSLARSGHEHFIVPAHVRQRDRGARGLAELPWTRIVARKDGAWFFCLVRGFTCALRKLEVFYGIAQ